MIKRHHQVNCDYCHGYMKVRQNRVKKNYFFGCSNYPFCDHTLTIRQFNNRVRGLIGDYEIEQDYYFGLDHDF